MTLYGLSKLSSFMTLVATQKRFILIMFSSIIASPLRAC
jgi:hypothetical protein